MKKSKMNILYRLKGANMDIDLAGQKISWKQDKCPWNLNDKTKKHKCAVKNISICKYFKGIDPLDIVKCNYKK